MACRSWIATIFSTAFWKKESYISLWGPRMVSWEGGTLPPPSRQVESSLQSQSWEAWTRTLLCQRKKDKLILAAQFYNQGLTHVWDSVPNGHQKFVDDSSHTPTLLELWLVLHLKSGWGIFLRGDPSLFSNNVHLVSLLIHDQVMDDVCFITGWSNIESRVAKALETRFWG